MVQPAYDLQMPARRDTAAVFASPHSGRNYPAGFLRDSVLDRRAIRSSEDAFVDELWGDATRHGAPLLCALAPRAYVDFNRDEGELDPVLVTGVGRIAHNPRVASGLGVIPRVVAGGRAIYRGKIGMRAAKGRLENHWRPYHATLTGLLEEAHEAFGEAILIDCHSMPHEAIEGVPGGKPEVVLGDRFGASAGSGIVDRIEARFQAEGLRVARNAPFAGAYIVQRYGHPARGRHALQIEIDRSLYMDESLIQPNGRFHLVRAILARVARDICDIGRRQVSLAAQ
ncbi:N-formylglutamate deformylase [Hasllibacter halocynthiae]|uniref:N-formylglutamate deformylase n=1 Tax=Hasllibacter halocynthiae TaxID=595589 RepID=A0A2T0X3Q9_9RHOB|nr:N-formylglutamate amidohydrolase [Hasllibacter halocynthiae]PRY93570.1 N-formylglutamate deformylase [Hasllibacter halocynthiae]